MKIDHVYCINLERSKERKANMKTQFENLGLDVEFFKACDGKAAGKDGVFGCAQSHLEVWRDIVAKGYENVLILEDDVYLDKNFKEYLEVLEPPTLWDILYLGTILPILGNKYEGHFTQGASLGMHGYIVNGKFALKLHSFDANDMQYDIDAYIVNMPLQTWICNKQLVHASPPGISSDIGFRISGALPFYIQLCKYFNVLEFLCILGLLLFLVKRLL